jgi:hypothetical protein
MMVEYMALPVCPSEISELQQYAAAQQIHLHHQEEQGSAGMIL